jgi:hypothetical protein
MGLSENTLYGKFREEEVLEHNCLTNQLTNQPTN